MTVTTLGEAWKLGWRLRVRCLVTGPKPKSRDREAVFCDTSAKLDMKTLVWTSGEGIPLEKLQGLFRCPKCGSHKRSPLRSTYPTSLTLEPRSEDATISVARPRFANLALASDALRFRHLFLLTFQGQRAGSNPRPQPSKPSLRRLASTSLPDVGEILFLDSFQLCGARKEPKSRRGSLSH
jgi:hypothetical protein